MAMPEQFSLRWNDFHSNLSQSFHALLEGEDLVDVTLAAEGQYVHAHKLILSVCSPYFKELFKTNPCEHPIVILKDVGHQELRQLLQFMYTGEVHVRQQELFGFLHTAELLQVKALTGGRDRSESPPPVAVEEESPPNPEAIADSQLEWPEEVTDTIMESENPPTKEEAARSPLKRLLKNASSKTPHNTKKKPRPIPKSPTHPESTELAYDGEPLIDFDNDMFHILPESVKDTAGWNCKTKCPAVKCPSCHRFFANRYNLKVHIRDKHDAREGTLQCDICQKRMRNPSCLRVHMYHHRKQAAYLAQISSQGDMNVVQNMVETKWRTSASLSGEFRDDKGYSPPPSRQVGRRTREMMARSASPTRFNRAHPRSSAPRPARFNLPQNAPDNRWRQEAALPADTAREADNPPRAPQRAESNPESAADSIVRIEPDVDMV